MNKCDLRDRWSGNTADGQTDALMVGENWQELRRWERTGDGCVGGLEDQSEYRYRKQVQRRKSGGRTTGGSGVSTRGRQGQGACPPDLKPRGTVMQVPPLFWHSNAIAGFTSQSLGLPAYACKTGSSTAIKLAPRMHQNMPFWAQRTNTLGRGHSHFSRPLRFFHPTPRRLWRFLPAGPSARRQRYRLRHTPASKTILAHQAGQ